MVPNAELVRACEDCGCQNLLHVSERERWSEEGQGSDWPQGRGRQPMGLADVSLHAHGTRGWGIASWGGWSAVAVGAVLGE